MDIEHAVALFHAYVDTFQTEAKDPAPLRLKRAHTMEVLDNARLLLRDMDVDGELERLALLAALFHDVGRFPQYQRWGTFSDPLSVDHGILGAQTLSAPPRGAGLLKPLPRRERAMIRAVVAMHNRRILPQGISPELRFLTRLVRDADKLDIMRVMLDHFSRQDNDPVVILHVKPDPLKYTQSVYEDVYEGRRGEYGKLRWTNDFKLMLVGWVHDLNFPESKRLLLRRGLLDALLDQLPDTEAMTMLKERIHAFLHQDMRNIPARSSCAQYVQ